jgi:hypothetical protein
MVIFATVTLQLLDKLTEGAIAILSGIAGYVLGGLERSSTLPGKETPPEDK